MGLVGLATWLCIFVSNLTTVEFEIVVLFSLDCDLLIRCFDLHEGDLILEDDA